MAAGNWICDRKWSSITMTDKDTSEKKNKNPELKNRQIRKDSTGKAKDNYRED